MILQRDNALLSVRDHIMGMLHGSLICPPPLTQSHIADLRLAASTGSVWRRDAIGKPIQLLSYPPYHSKYTPIERC